MQPIAFLSAFTCAPLGPAVTPHTSRRCHLPSAPRRVIARRAPRTPRASVEQPQHAQPPAAPPPSSTSQQQRARIGIIATATVPERETKEIKIDIESVRNGFLGFKPKAYWNSIDIFSLFFTAFGLSALGIKMFKLKRGEMTGGKAVVNKLTVPKTAITTEEEEAELHIFKCGGCGYEIYPARGREFKFFPDSFKCPLCGTPKSEFWDLNDPTDPRNQEPEDDDDDDDDDNGDDDDSPDGARELETSPETQTSAVSGISVSDGSAQAPDAGNSSTKDNTPSSS